MTSYFGKSWSFGLLCMSFEKVYHFMCVLLSRLVMRVRGGIRFYIILIIVFLSAMMFSLFGSMIMEPRESMKRKPMNLLCLDAQADLSFIYN